jgi:endonuclease YncB( thermonuclease family)
MGCCCGRSKPIEPVSTPKEPTIDPYHCNDLKSQSFNELEKFTFKGLLTKAKIVSVYDGDTVTLVFYYHDQPIKDSFRLAGYDAPEIKPAKTLPDRELHIKAGHHVRDYLCNLIEGAIVWVSFCQEEKYGRLMGDLYLVNITHPDHFEGDEIHVNRLMIKKGYGKPYDGGRKSPFTPEELALIVSEP